MSLSVEFHPGGEPVEPSEQVVSNKKPALVERPAFLFPAFYSPQNCNIRNVIQKSKTKNTTFGSRFKMKSHFFILKKNEL
ncbi:hypothetical protein EDS67_13610 [candidate division KSB1 bacterium]|nr:MAG: hypothetical protein EDS67_13610 [candidate division KSB1 bacterium]MBC6951466.1 hypothetical protein [candidate division KSB1 bacterium]MCE7942868.1 hypothetical protein [Chlorobi bacterium CHB1]